MSTHVIDVVLVFLLLTLNILYTLFYCYITDFEQVNSSWAWETIGSDNEFFIQYKVAKG